MPGLHPQFNPEHLYFVTTTACNHRHIFARQDFRRLLLDALDCLRLRQHSRLYAFVIMPNHIHLLAQFDNRYPLAAFIRDFKKWTADRILRQLRVEDDQSTLAGLKDEKGFHVWEGDYDARDVFTGEFLIQKLNYIHSNPCQEHWQLAETSVAYMWSSAAFYETDSPCLIPIDDVRHLLEPEV